MWIDDYVKLLFPIRGSKIKIEEALSLKYQNMPTTLYKYRSTAEHNLRNLEQGVEWQSYPTEFNDPFDASLTISTAAVKKEMFKEQWFERISQKITLTPKEKIEIVNADDPISMFIKIGISHDPSLQEHTAKDLDELVGKIDMAINLELETMILNYSKTASSGYLVSCFSEEKDNRLMWSHYADNHRGYCVGYNFKEQGPGNPLVRILHPTIYNPERFDATEYYKNITRNGTKDFNNLYGMYPTISKDKVWEYEKEWRTVNPLFGPGIPLADSEHRLLNMPRPIGIYLGARIDESDKGKILAIAKNKHIAVYQITLDRDGYALGKENIYLP